MSYKGKIAKLPKVNWKLLITMILIIILGVGVIKSASKFIFKGDKEVVYMILDKQQIPEKINEILPKYKMLERALATKVEDEVYVIVTRGEKLTAGYSVDISKIEVTKEDEGIKVIVHALFKDPGPDDIVTQTMTYPYAVVKTELKEFPKKIDLQIVYTE